MFKYLLLFKYLMEKTKDNKMDLKDFIDWCEGDLVCVEKAINLMGGDEINFDNFAECNVYAEGEWEINSPPFGSN